MNQPSSIPSELRAAPHWVAVRVVWNDKKGKFDKFPVDPKTGKAGAVDNPATWGTFEQALNFQGTGGNVGFVFTTADPFVVIDLDGADNPELTRLHMEIVKAADSYTETSVSGKGSHIIVRAQLTHGLRDDNQGIEIYPDGRFVLITGDQYAGDGINEGQELVDYVTGLIGANRVDRLTHLETFPSQNTDEKVYQLAADAENGKKFVALFRGDWMDYREYQDDRSRADLALLTFLDFYTKDVDQCIRMFKLSGLYRVEKGRRDGDATDYIVRTLKAARARNEKDTPPPVDMANIAAQAEAVLQEAQHPEQLPAQQDFLAPARKMAEDLEKERNAIANGNPLPAKGKVVKPPSRRSIPLPPGLIGDMTMYFYQSATRPVPEVALMGALALMAGLAGRQFNIPGSGLNLYLILLAPTGCGKEGAKSGIDSLLKAVRETVPSVDQFRGPADYSSGPAVIKALGAQPCLFSVMGEFGLRMQQMCDPRANGAEQSLQKAMLNMFSKSGWHQSESPSAYSDTTKNTQMLYAPALTLFGESTPETFFEALSTDHIQSGLLPRFIFLEYDGPRPSRNTKTAFCAPPETLVQNTSDLASTCLQMQVNQTCQGVGFTPDAKALLDKFDVRADKKINGGGEFYKQLWNRAHLKALRLSALIAVGCNWHSPVVDVDHATWAINFVEQDMMTIERRFVSGSVGSGEITFEAELRKYIIQYLAMDPGKRIANYKAGASFAKDPVIPFSYLRRRFRRFSGIQRDRRGIARAIDDTLKDVVNAGIIQKIPASQVKAKYDSTVELYCVGDEW